jgi:hypothetical protein
MSERIEELEGVAIRAANALQYNLGMAQRKDEKIMYSALVSIWNVIGRERCEAPEKGE